MLQYVDHSNSFATPSMKSEIRKIIVAIDFSMRQPDRRPTGKLFGPARLLDV
jgi:hypothetical protein